MSTEVKVPRIPNCDLCEQEGRETPATVDGRTVFGPWANMCEAHWTEHGVGQLGTGYGQRLILAE